MTMPNDAPIVGNKRLLDELRRCEESLSQARTDRIVLWEELEYRRSWDAEMREHVYRDSNIRELDRLTAATDAGGAIERAEADIRRQEEKNKEPTL